MDLKRLRNNGRVISCFFAMIIGALVAYSQSPTPTAPAPPTQSQPGRGATSPDVKVTLTTSSAATCAWVPPNTTRTAATQKAGSDALGPLPIGTGYAYALSYLTEVKGTVVKPNPVPAGLTFRFRRYVSLREWSIIWTQSAGYWDVWLLRKRGVNPIQGPRDDDPDGASDNNFPTAQTIYSWDASGVILMGTECQRNDFVLCEKKFIYFVECRSDGAEWAKCSDDFVLYQTIIAERTADNSGTVAGDWTSRVNIIRTTPQTTSLLLNDDTKIRGIVGGTNTIHLSAGVNSDAKD